MTISPPLSFSHLVSQVQQLGIRELQDPQKGKEHLQRKWIQP